LLARLEGDLAGQLHGARVVQEFLIGAVEEGVAYGLEGVAAGEAGDVDVVYRAGVNWAWLRRLKAWAPISSE
jgi:hypothetical protein